MNLKKIFLGLAATCLFAIPSVFAQSYLMANQFKLGGLALGSSKGYVHTIYGQPDSTRTQYTDTPYGTTRIDYIENYGNSVSIDYAGLVGRFPITDASGVFMITVTANNGWATEQGATVGMDESKLREIYGDRFDTFVNEDGITCYQYSGYHSPYCYVFGIKNHKVVSILMTNGE